MITILNQLRDKHVNIVLNSGMPVPGIVGPTDEQNDVVEMVSQVQVPEEETNVQIPVGRGGKQPKVLNVHVFVRVSQISMIQERVVKE